MRHLGKTSDRIFQMTDASRIALVTGASRGLGFAVASALGAAGWHVIALARTIGGLEELADVVEAAGGATTLVPLDLTDDAGLQRMALAIHERWGRLDLLVHAAAHAAPCASSGAVAEKDLDRSLAVNARGTQRLIVMCDPLLKAAKDGRAVYVDDSRAGGFFTAYAASKAAGRAMVTAWAEESAQIGPKVTSFEPNPMPTALRARFYPGEDRDALADPTGEAARLIASLT